MNLFVFVEKDETRQYWRGPEESADQAKAAIIAAGFTPIFVERLK